MSKQALRDFKKVWLNTYIKQYKEDEIYSIVTKEQMEAMEYKIV